MNEIQEQRAAINTLLEQGYIEYYFHLGDFELESVRSYFLPQKQDREETMTGRAGLII